MVVLRVGIWGFQRSSSDNRQVVIVQRVQVEVGWYSLLYLVMTDGQ